MKSYSTARTILFWMLMVIVAVVLWKMASPSDQSARGREIIYSDLIAQVEKENVREVTLYISEYSYELQGEYREPTSKFFVKMPKEFAPDLLRALQQKGVPIRTMEVYQGTWTSILLNGLPIILLVAFWIFMVRQMRVGKGALWWARRLALPRLGLGYDLHRLEYGRKLIVGGIEMPFEKGPVSHSDGDVLTHAICDALLGAAGAGDIGTLFPDTDPKWKGASSLVFLKHVATVLAERKLHIGHIDAVVIAERPKLGPHFPAMREAMARALQIKPAQISLKAKTNEGVDAVGRGEAIAAHAIATLEA